MVAAGVLVVTVAGNRYAVRLDRVVEVVRMVALTPLPDADPWVLGVADVRGTPVPVVALGRRLGLDTAPPGVDSRIVVLLTKPAGPGSSPEPVGLAVDDVVEVAETGMPVSAPAASGAVPASFRTAAGDLVVLLDDSTLTVGLTGAVGR